MNHFNSIRELLNTLSRGNKLIAEMFEKRKTPSYRYEYAAELAEVWDLRFDFSAVQNIDLDIIRQCVEVGRGNWGCC